MLRPVKEEAPLPPEDEAAIEAMADALTECGLMDASARSACINRLINLPFPLLAPMLSHTIGAPPQGFIDEIIGNDFQDAKASLFRSGATWSELTPAERKRANRKWRWAVDDDPTTFSSQRKGAPLRFDSALALYIMFVLREALDIRKFTFTSGEGGERSGKHLTALLAAFRLPRSPEASLPPIMSGEFVVGDIPTPQSIVATVIMPAESALFRKTAQEWGLALTADAVAAAPATYRALLAACRNK